MSPASLFVSAGLLADHHNRLDTSELDSFFVVLVVVCVVVGFIVKRLDNQ